MESDEIHSDLPEVKKHSVSLFVIVLGLLIGSFFGGIVVSRFIWSNVQSPPDNPMLTPTLAVNESPEVTQWKVGSHYFDDTIIMITKDTPRRILVASDTRSEESPAYRHTVRVSYFDGTKWSRKVDSFVNTNETIVSSSLVSNWQTIVDPSRVLKESSEGKILFGSTVLSFSTGGLENELGVRSLPGYTKFMSSGIGTLSIDQGQVPAYVLYSRIYSLNASEIQLYNQLLGLTTNWVSFWDEEGNFYHADATSVEKPTETYKTHTIGIVKDSMGAVSKTFNITVDQDSNTPPHQFTVTFGSPVDDVLTLNLLDSIDKAPSDKYFWQMGFVEGYVRTHEGVQKKGIGLVEYIREKK